nr:DMT family transporter [Haloarchaeobius amylolyticus]
MAVLGTVVVLAGQYDFTALAGGSLLGILGLVVASVAWAVYTIHGTPLVREYSALATTAYSAAAAVPIMAVFAAAELAVVGVPALPGPVGVAAVGYLGVAATAAAWYLWYRGVESVDAGTVAVFFFVQPVVGTALGVLVLDESVGAGFVAGGVVMAAGIWLVSTERD